jgi:hypothetical protein
MEGKDFRLAKEIKYIQHQAAKHDGRFVTIGPLVFFSTETGDAWMLDPSCQLAARLARDGDPEPIDFEETDANYAIGWKGNYRIEGRAFVYIDRKSGPDHHDPWLSYRRNCAIGLNRKPVRHLPGKTQITGSPSEQSPKSFCRLTAAARNERSAVERKIPLPSQR